MTKVLETLLYGSIRTISAFAAFFLLVYIITDVANLFKVEFITEMDKLPLIGTILLIGYFTSHKPSRFDVKNAWKSEFKNENKTSNAEEFGYASILLFIKVMAMLNLWLVSYIIHWWLS